MTGGEGADEFRVDLADLTHRSHPIWADADALILNVFEGGPMVAITDYDPTEDQIVVESDMGDPMDARFEDDGAGGTNVVLDFGEAENNRGVLDEIEVTVNLAGIAPGTLSPDMIAIVATGG